jgi:hypothetical protein
MYNMEIIVFGYKLKLEILILIGVVYLILVGHTICGTCNVPKIMEGLQIMEGYKLQSTKNIKVLNNKTKSPSLGAPSSGAVVRPSAGAGGGAVAAASAASAAALAREAAEDKAAAEDAAFVQEVFTVWKLSLDNPYRDQHEARLLKIPRDERDAFLKNIIESKASQDERDAQDKARRGPDRAREAREARDRDRFKADFIAMLEKQSPDQREQSLYQAIRSVRESGGDPDMTAFLNDLLASYSKKEGFTGSKTSSWSAQNMSLVQGHSLPDFYPGTYSNSKGSAYLDSNSYNYLVTTGGNNLPYSQY